MGLKVVLSDVAFTDTTLPKLEKDPIITDGSLLLVDFSNSNGYTGSVLPTNNQVINNIVWDKAASLIGSGTQNTLSPSFLYTGFTTASSSLHMMEFTPKKGLHVIVSQNPGLASAYNMRISLPTAIATYIYNNLPGREFYISMWSKTTRPAPASNSPATPRFLEASSGSAYVTQFGLSNVLGAKSNSLYYRTVSNLNTANVVGIQNIAVNNYTGTKSAVDPASVTWGTYGAWNTLSAQVSPSWVFYKLYIEDLTASGRTYTQVDALDYALWQEAFAPGGRFYGDTYTDPATIA